MMILKRCLLVFMLGLCAHISAVAEEDVGTPILISVLALNDHEASQRCGYALSLKTPHLRPEATAMRMLDGMWIMNLDGRDIMMAQYGEDHITVNGKSVLKQEWGGGGYSVDMIVTEEPSCSGEDCEVMPVQITLTVSKKMRKSATAILLGARGC
ncbi:MAG: hypothetical protein Q9M17_01485 [Mariprofundus sp.]|nr:hypothetical protein [Mariprofundus sp.]